MSHFRTPEERATDRAAVLRESADWFERDGRAVQQMFGHQVAALLRRMAAEAQQQPETDGAGEPAELRTLPREVRRLVHAVDRMRSDWAEAPERGPERRELWTEVHSACDAVWDRLDPNGVEAQQQPDIETPRRCASVDIVYGRCILPIPGHLDCFHERQPIRIDEETDEDSLCSAEYPGDDNFVGQLCGLPKDHFGDHRCDEAIGAGHTALLRWKNEARP